MVSMLASITYKLLTTTWKIKYRHYFIKNNNIS